MLGMMITDNTGIVIIDIIGMMNTYITGMLIHDDDYRD